MAEKHKCPLCGNSMESLPGGVCWRCENTGACGYRTYTEDELALAAATRAREIAAATEPLRGLLREMLEMADCNGQGCNQECAGCVWDNGRDCRKRSGDLCHRVEDALEGGQS
jgi:hypothetical protein